MFQFLRQQNYHYGRRRNDRDERREVVRKAEAPAKSRFHHSALPARGRRLHFSNNRVSGSDGARSMQQDRENHRRKDPRRQNLRSLLEQSARPATARSIDNGA